MLALTTEAALDILIDWLQDNINCDCSLIFDNDDDQTHSAMLLPRVRQERNDVRTLRLLQQLHNDKKS
ncbi:hypothetical protein [Kluyvera ascorbata]|uniref:hypothetical protein n=1 Tax=Kluyvera ascorbata TaxID=51288 RepID=UPI002067BBFF|nr:hypothetical protein [Kluyvera ascorbata]UPQ70168.1 hypothetical protein MY052_15550 [Kluyvera ascorbata]